MICLNTNLAYYSLNFLLFLTQLRRSPPGHSSITIRLCFSMSNVSSILMTLGCLSIFRILISFDIFFFELSSFMYSILIDLIATSFLVSLCNPMLTFPNAPFPSIFPILYSSSCVLGGFPYLSKHSLISVLIRVTSLALGDCGLLLLLASQFQNDCFSKQLSGCLSKDASYDSYLLNLGFFVFTYQLNKNCYCQLVYYELPLLLPTVVPFCTTNGLPLNVITTLLLDCYLINDSDCASPASNCPIDCPLFLVGT